MLQHNLKLAYRSYKRSRSTFFINLVGLSTGLACTLLIYLWVRDELRVDKFHEKDGRLYQVLYNGVSPNKIETGDGTPGPLGEALAKEIPEVEYVATVAPPDPVYAGVIALGDKSIKATPYYVNKDFVNVFTCNFIQGDPNQALLSKNAVSLSEELAMKLFNTTQNVIGRTIEWKHTTYGGPFTVAGIFETVPAVSSLQYDVLFNFQVFLDQRQDLLKWNSSQPRTYVVLKEGADIDLFNAKIKKMHWSRLEKPTESTLFAQRFSDKYLYGKYENGQPVEGRMTYVKLFSIIALFILAIACINFVNLSTARASVRLKEVGVKKVVGATRTDLLVQYMGEALLLSLISLIVGIVIVLILLPQFNLITGKQLHLEFTPPVILSVVGILLLTGIGSGIYPALYLSGFHAATVLKGRLSNTSIGGLLARKGLVIFQFTISVILIVSVMVVYKQMEFVQNKNLGYTRDNVISFAREGELEENYKAFLSELKNVQGVVSASYMKGNLAGGVNSRSGVWWEGQNPGNADAEFKYLSVGFDAIETLGITVKEGRSFSSDFPSDSNAAIIFNEAAIDLMQLKDPIGKTVEFDGTRQIVGVVKNFHFESLHEKVNPIFFKINYYWKGGDFLVKIRAGDERATLERIQQVYGKYNPAFPFDFRFMDADYQRLYVAEQRVATLSRYFAGLAIVISGLGLLALSAFTAERRFKEMGIRKALGLSDWGILYLLSKDFTKMVIIAICLAVPVSYVILSNWLANFEYRIELSIWYFLAASVLTLCIAWLIIGMQTVKSTRVNLSDCLRANE